MSVESINPISAFEPSAVEKPVNISSDFSAWLSSGIAEMNEQHQAANASIEKVLAGDVDNLHQVIMQISKAERTFEFAVQVRNRLLEGYQEIMRMQV